MARDAQRLRIIAADDDPVMRRLFETYLPAPTYDIAVVSDGEFVMEEIRRKLPDIIFLDVIMPNIDGLTVLNQIHQIEEYGNIPVIIITSRTDTVTLIQAIEGNATDFLSKPFTREKLHHKVHFARMSEAAQQHIAGLQFVDLSGATLSAGQIEESRRTLLLNIEFIYLSLLRLVVNEDVDRLLALVWRLLDITSLLEIKPAKGKIVQLIAAVKANEWENAILYLEEIYIFFKDLARQEKLS